MGFYLRKSVRAGPFRLGVTGNPPTSWVVWGDESNSAVVADCGKHGETHNQHIKEFCRLHWLRI